MLKKPIKSMAIAVIKRIVFPIDNPKISYKKTCPIAPDLYMGLIISKTSEKKNELTSIPKTKTRPSILPPPVAITDVAGQYPPITIPAPNIHPAII